MTDPIATPDDLATYIGGTVDEPRATLLLRLAQSLVEARVSPPPPGADAIVLTAAARAYQNPSMLTGETVGPYTAQRPAVGIYLTRSERASLRKMAGGSLAFTINPAANAGLAGLPWWDLNLDPAIVRMIDEFGGDILPPIEPPGE